MVHTNTSNWRSKICRCQLVATNQAEVGSLQNHQLMFLSYYFTILVQKISVSYVYFYMISSLLVGQLVALISKLLFNGDWSTEGFWWNGTRTGSTVWPIQADSVKAEPWTIHYPSIHQPTSVNQHPSMNQHPSIREPTSNRQPSIHLLTNVHPSIH